MKREDITLPSLISTLTETENAIMEARARRRRLLQQAEAIEALAASVPDASFIFSSYRDAITLNQWITVPGFTTEASPELAAHLELFSLRFGVDPTSEDCPNESLRRYRFLLPQKPHEPTFEFVLWAVLDTASEACQRIQTGTITRKKIVWEDEEVPTFAFKC